MKLFTRFLWLTFISTLIMIIAYPLVPVAVLFADNDGRLPKMFRWFETHDDLGWGAGTYIESVKKIYDKYGKKIALIWWLWRNKAYAFRDKYRATPNYSTMVMSSSGSIVPVQNGFFYWWGTITDGDVKWFEFSPGISIAGYYIQFRCGWKLMPYFRGHFPVGPTATGMFAGILPRVGNRKDYW